MAYTGQAATGAWGAGVSSETLGMRVGIGQTGSGQALKASSVHVIRLSIFVPDAGLVYQSTQAAIAKYHV